MSTLAPSVAASAAPAPAPATDGTTYAPLVDEPDTSLNTTGQPVPIPTSLAATPTAAASNSAWWQTPAICSAPMNLRAHFATDMQQGCWWMLLGCAIYVLVMVNIVSRDASRLDKWLELVAALIFLAGCWYLVEASYPATLMALFERLAAPPKPSRTFFERYVTSSSMMLSTQLFNLGMLPYLLEGALNMLRPPIDDPPGAAFQLFLGVLLGMPLLLLFSASATEEAMRTNGGLGTAYSWEYCVAPTVRALGWSTEWWQRHCGTDNLFIFWMFFLAMAVSCVMLVPLWLMDPRDEQHLCGWSMSCGAGLLVSLPFTFGSGLMVRAAYPENAGKPSLLGEWLRALGQWLIDVAQLLEPDPLPMAEEPTA